MTQQGRPADPAPASRRHEEKLAEFAVLIVIVFVVIEVDIVFATMAAGDRDTGEDTTRTTPGRCQQKQPAKLVVVVIIVAVIIVDIVRDATSACGSNAKNRSATAAAAGGGDQQQAAEATVFTVVIVFIFDVVEVVLAKLLGDCHLPERSAPADAAGKRELCKTSPADVVSDVI